MHFNFITIFPDLIRQSLQYGVIGQALKKGLFTVNVINLRDFTEDNHKTVDDRPFGGGDGMVMRADILSKAILSLKNPGHRVYLSASGTPWQDQQARKWSTQLSTITLVCGRYGGVDQRFINEHIDSEISIGDYVVSGGEMPALVLLDSVVRHVPQVLGHESSAEQDSFLNGLLESPQFTRPSELSGIEVPEVFRSGDHKKIQEMRLALSVVTTALKRPDLFINTHADLSAALKTLSVLSDSEIQACGLSRPQLKQLESF